MSAQAQVAPAQARLPLRPYYDDGQSVLYHGSFQDADQYQVGIESLDAIITDPPYPREYERLYEDLGLWALAALQRGGSLLSIVPHYNLPYVLSVVPLKYRWCIAMEQGEGAHPRMAMGIEVCWKPVVWWVKGAWPQGRGYRRDLFVSRNPADERRKKHHPWEQNLSWAEAMLKFVPPGGLVCDPMMGSGTVLVAARRLGYPAIGIDVDEACCEMTARRLEALRAGDDGR